MAYVSVVSPVGRTVYVNGIYTNHNNRIPAVFELAPGSYRFETRCLDGTIDHRGDVHDIDLFDDITLDLAQVAVCVHELSGGGQ